MKTWGWAWACGTVALLGCAAVRLDGTPRTEVTLEDAVEVSKKLDVIIRKAIPVYDESRAVTDLVQRVGHRVADASSGSSISWQFVVLDDPTVNAYSSPGGFVYVPRGIITHANSEDELAALLAHEIGHVVSGHSNGAVAAYKASQEQKGWFKTNFMGGDALFATVRHLTSMRHSRADELEADALAIRYLRDAGYDPRRFADLMDLLTLTENKSARVQVWNSTHPSTKRRMRETHEAVGAPTRIVSLEYFESIAGVAYGADPRSGSVRGDRYVHPRREFVIDLPTGWIHTPGSNRVASISEGERTSLTISPHRAPSPSVAMDKFADELSRSRELDGLGVVFGKRVAVVLDGMPCETAPFNVGGSRGVAGMVAFVRMPGQTYLMLAYALRQYWVDESGEVARSFSSFVARAPKTSPVSARTRSPCMSSIATPACESFASGFRRRSNSRSWPCSTTSSPTSAWPKVARSSGSRNTSPKSGLRHRRGDSAPRMSCASRSGLKMRCRRVDCPARTRRACRRGVRCRRPRA